MMINKLFVTLSISLLLFGSGRALAQRTVPGEWLAGVGGMWCGGRAGGEITFGRYLWDSCWSASLLLRGYSCPMSSGGSLPYSDFALQGRWDYRVLSTRSRSLSLYAGAGVFAGYEAYDPFSALPETLETGLGDGGFLYGVTAGLRAEIFLIRQAALVFGAECPLNFTSAVRRFHYELTLGVRVNL